MKKINVPYERVDVIICGLLAAHDPIGIGGPADEYSSEAAMVAATLCSRQHDMTANDLTATLVEVFSRQFSPLGIGPEDRYRGIAIAIMAVMEDVRSRLAEGARRLAEKARTSPKVEQPPSDPARVDLDAITAHPQITQPLTIPTFTDSTDASTWLNSGNDDLLWAEAGNRRRSTVKVMTDEGGVLMIPYSFITTAYCLDGSSLLLIVSEHMGNFVIQIDDCIDYGEYERTGPS